LLFETIQQPVKDEEVIQLNWSKAELMLSREKLLNVSQRKFSLLGGKITCTTSMHLL